MLRIVVLLLLVAAPAAAQGLMGHRVVMNIVTWDDPFDVHFRVGPLEVTVTEEKELGLGTDNNPAEAFNLIGFDMDIGADRIDVSFPHGSGQFYDGVFNGYVLDFPTPCPRVIGAALDEDATSWALQPARVHFAGGRVMVNLSGLVHDPDSRIGLTLELEACLDPA